MNLELGHLSRCIRPISIPNHNAMCLFGWVLSCKSPSTWVSSDSKSHPLQLSPELAGLYVSSLLEAYLLYAPHAHCLFCAPGTETRLRHSFLAVISQTHDCKPNSNCRCNSALNSQPSPAFPCAPPSDGRGRTGAGGGGLGPAAPSQQLDKHDITARGLRSESRSDPGFD